jgi:hypothetical protein
MLCFPRRECCDGQIRWRIRGGERGGDHRSILKGWGYGMGIEGGYYVASLLRTRWALRNEHASEPTPLPCLLALGKRPCWEQVTLPALLDSKLSLADSFVVNGFGYKTYMASGQCHSSSESVHQVFCMYSSHSHSDLH